RSPAASNQPCTDRGARDRAALPRWARSAGDKGAFRTLGTAISDLRSRGGPTSARPHCRRRPAAAGAPAGGEAARWRRPQPGVGGRRPRTAPLLPAPVVCRVPGAGLHAPGTRRGGRKAGGTGVMRGAWVRCAGAGTRGCGKPGDPWGPERDERTRAMCRWLAYSGTPILLDSILYRPAHSLIDQSLHAKMGVETTNGDGFGVGWYGDGDGTPAVLREIGPAWSNRNLREIARHVRSRLFFAHIRASTGSAVQQTNCHPFRHGPWMWMHNGAIEGFDRVRRDLLLAVDPDL